MTMPHLLEIDLAALALVSGWMVVLLRQGLRQGRAKRAMENGLVSAQAPIAMTPYVASRTVFVDDEAQESENSARHPVWSDVGQNPAEMPYFEAIQSPSASFDVAFESSQSFSPVEVALEPNEVYFAGDPVAETVAEEPAAPELPREHVGILFLEDECDLTALKLAGITELEPRNQPSDSVPTASGNAAPVEFIDGLYADPIDGMPFTPGEEVTPCACGTAYRLETAVWLREEANGECVQCHRKLTGEVRRIPEQGEPQRMSASA